MPDSKAQARLAFAIDSGDARNSTMPRSVAREIVAKIHQRGPGALKSLPERASTSKGNKK